MPHDRGECFGYHSTNGGIGPGAAGLSYDVYHHYLEDMLEGEQYLLYSYRASSFRFAVPRDTEFFFTGILPLATAQDARDYLTRLRLVDEKFAQLQDKVALPLSILEQHVDRVLTHP